MKKTEASLKDAQETFNDLMVKGDAPLKFDEAFEMLDNAPDAVLVSVSQDYFTFEKKDTPVSFVVEKIGTTTMQGKEVEVVYLRTKDGQSYVNGDKVLVSSCKRLNQLPAWIKVTYTGDTKTSVGSYKNLTVKTFPAGNS